MEIEKDMNNRLKELTKEIERRARINYIFYSLVLLAVLLLSLVWFINL